MFRSLLAGLLAAGLVFAAGLPGSGADDKQDVKKAPPKKRERIAVAEPKDAAKDADFAIQGEYTGEVARKDGKQKIGAQVIAKGLGEFDINVYSGGLPGEGWDGKAPKKATAQLSVLGGADVTGVKLRGVIGGTFFNLKDDEAKSNTDLTRVERKSKTLGEKPPEGATVLWGAAGDEKNWTNGKLMALSDGTFLTVAKTGGIKTKEKFGAFKAHVEFRLPWMPNSSGQGRGNSGVYLQDRYECQVLDSFGLKGENNECGGIYTQHKPLVNMCLPPLVWQTYDIEFTPAAFVDGKKTKNGRATIYHNGVKIHDDIEFPKECPGGQKEEAAPGPFQFQDHGDPVNYRNVWVLPLKKG